MASRVRRSRAADAVMATVATDTARQTAAPPTANRWAPPSVGVASGYDTGRERVTAEIGAVVASPLTAANASTTPCPTTGSHAVAGRCAVSSMRRMTCRAVHSGDRDRTSATMPLTTGAAYL